MHFNPRILTIDSVKDASLELEKIECHRGGIGIMAEKALFRTIKLERIPSKAANLLKQTFLAKGGEVAVTHGTADLSAEYSDVLICATLKQYRIAVNQLKAQPWGLPKVAGCIEAVLGFAESSPDRQYQWNNCQLTIAPHKTLVMGILNITPDSFSDGGKFNDVQAAVDRVMQMIADGADIIDIGAESTRPYAGSEKISAEEEMARLLPVLETVLACSTVPVSVDTYKASVANEALKLGAHLINDVWGLQHDGDMAAVAAKYGVPVVVMHNQIGHHYQGDVMAEVCRFLQKSIDIGVNAGIDRNNIIIDPGIGFGKAGHQNLAVLARLEELRSLGCPVLLGTSRKRFIGDVLDAAVDDRVEGTGATVALGIHKGAHIVRVHDVKAMARIAKMTDAIIRGGQHG